MSSIMLSVIAVSLKVALIATTIVMLLSILFALALARKPSKALKALEILAYLTMALPPVALGYGLLLLFGRNSFVGIKLHHIFGIDVSFTMLGAIVAACVVSFGIGLRTVRTAFENVDRGQVHIARLIGASDWQIAWHIYVPQCFQAILGGAVAVFVRAISEFRRNHCARGQHAWRNPDLGIGDLGCYGNTRPREALPAFCLNCYRDFTSCNCFC